MKVVGLIPYWSGYCESENDETPRNLKKVGGRYLINYSIQLLNRITCIDDVVVYASSAEIINYIEEDLKYTHATRPSKLDSVNVGISEIISEFLNVSDGDIIVLLHPNSPFLQVDTLEDCIEKVKTNSYDSAFTAYKYNKFAWFKGQPLNYSLDNPTPQINSIEPVIFEQSSLYIFSRKMFNKRQNRIGEKPYIKYINHFEGHDVNNTEDYEIANLIVNAGMYEL